MEAPFRPLGALLVIAAVLGIAACGGGGDKTDAEATGTAPSPNVGRGEGRVARLDEVVKVGEPTSVVTAPGDPGTLYITTKPGEVIVVKDGKLQDEPFLDIRDLVNSKGSEQGMFAIAFPPDYATSGRFYVSHNKQNNSVQIDEFRRSQDNPLVAEPGYRRSVLNAPHGKGDRTQHNGGELEFGPDGYLYIGLGDAGPVEKPFVSNRGQQRSAILGKILRIDPAHPFGHHGYTTPADNPFAGMYGTNGRRFRGEIYSYGLRNPFRFSFDSKSGAMVIGDVGAADWEEVDYLPKGEAKGANFGWPHFEGTHRFRTDYPISPGGRPGPLVKPIFTYGHKRGCSVIGGYVMHDPRIPQLDGKYIYGDACTGDIRVFTPSPDGVKDDHSLGLRLPPTFLFGIVSFGEGSDGRIYAASFAGGVYALNPQAGGGGGRD